MAISRRNLMKSGAAGALAALGSASPVLAQNSQQSPKSPYPMQVSSDRPAASPEIGVGASGYDMRDALSPRRLTFAMWDVAYALRHGPGGSFADYDRVLDEAVERGYNTIRFEPSASGGD